MALTKMQVCLAEALVIFGILTVAGIMFGCRALVYFKGTSTYGFERFRWLYNVVKFKQQYQVCMRRACIFL